MPQSQAQPSSLTDDGIISFNVIGSNFELGRHGVIRDFVLEELGHDGQLGTVDYAAEFLYRWCTPQMEDAMCRARQRFTTLNF